MSSDPKHLPADPLIGQCIGDYRIERELGRGGMGIVYLARHLHLDRYAAIKTLSPHALHAASARQRFVREAQALARVKAPGLVDILSVGETPEGLPFIVMEYLEGQTLDKRLKQRPDGPLALDTALLWTEQLFVTLQELHEHRVIHRDIKPENIMLVTDGAVPGGERAKILDLGIAKLLEESEPLTRTETQPGTGPYMSPEACEGSKTIDGKADVYALGCVLYELLCGRPPFTLQDGGSVMVKHIQQRPERPRTRRADLPPAVDDFVMALLRKDPSARLSAAQAITRIQSLRNNPHQRVPLRGRVLRSFFGAHLALRIGMPLIALICLALLTLWKMELPPFHPTGMVLIPGGAFMRGTKDDAQRQWRARAGELDRMYKSRTGTARYLPALDQTLEREVQVEVSIQPFWMDQYEITCTKMAKFLNKGIDAGDYSIDRCPMRGAPQNREDDVDCVYQKGPPNVVLQQLTGSDLYMGLHLEKGRVEVREGYENRPAVGMSWHGAALYCTGKGKQLPTEDQWEYAASNGGTTVYPWGNDEPTCDTTVIERQSPFAYEERLGGVQDDKIFSACHRPEGKQRFLPIGSVMRDRNRWNVYDLGGNVAEWTVSLYRKVDDAQTDYVLRGGSWVSDYLSTRAASRLRAASTDRMAGVGFRCVKAR